MKVLLIITRSDTVGGAQVHVKDLAFFLQNHGHEVLVITGEKGPFNDFLNSFSINSTACEYFKQSINPWLDWQTLWFIVETIRQLQPDIVATHSSKAGILGRLAAKITNIPCVFTAHGWAFTDGIPEPNRSVYEVIEKWVEPITDKVICVSENDRQIALKAGMSADKLVMIHYGIEDVPHHLRSSHQSNDTVRILMVARFDAQKDYATLIKAFKSIENAQLELLGSGPKLEEIKTMVSQMNMTDRVNFRGFCSNVSEMLPQGDIFTLITNWEGFPYAIIEAMRAEMPIIASQVGGVAESVIDGITGYCVPRGDVETLRNRLEKLVNDAQLRREMGIQGRQKYEAELTLEQMCTKTLNIYQDVIHRRQLKAK
ncbi:glycosyltransferase family 1 protein [Pseudanabaena sp. SR411]|uniref:glycosyltransferase family 4 protein n=1 Tax=Pseudanabaena sp. SR411 TaxID=1980935 RepID=UPI000B982A18|nr:glycosyltransferase family 4 protein [Pseudanabaena sp. SR411]OYQ63073.1 glycosyltransferase family 1 protein [Pseudanabaena sp. SR411]